jgi:hypothetical protein
MYTHAKQIKGKEKKEELVIISRFIEHMVPMSTNTRATEKGREFLAFRYLAFVDSLISAFWLADEEFTGL